MFQNDEKTIRFTFLCSPEERLLLRSIAKQLNRTQGDSIRLLIRTAGQELHPIPSAQNKEILNRKKEINMENSTLEGRHD